MNLLVENIGFWMTITAYLVIQNEMIAINIKALNWKISIAIETKRFLNLKKNYYFVAKKQKRNPY